MLGVDAAEAVLARLRELEHVHPTHLTHGHDFTPPQPHTVTLFAADGAKPAVTAHLEMEL